MPTTYNVRHLVPRTLYVTDSPFQVTLNPDAPHEKLQEAKDQVTDKGGKITHEFALVKGFTYVTTPHTLKQPC
jgi:hypothetical protein